MTKKYSSWTNRQIELLKEHFPKASKEELEAMFAPHPWGSIRETARLRRIKRHRVMRDWNSICAAHVMQTGLFKV